MFGFCIDERHSGSRPGIDGDHRLIDDVFQVAFVPEDLGELCRFPFDIRLCRRLRTVAEAREEGACEVLVLLGLTDAHTSSSLMNFSAISMWEANRRVERMISPKA